MKNELLYSELTDEHLMALYQGQNSRDAYSELYRRYYERLVRFLIWLGGYEGEAKDLAQTIFLNLFEKPVSFDTSRSFKTWIFVVAKNRWYNQERDREKRRALQRLFQESDKKAGEEQDMAQQDLWRIQQALETLSVKHKEVFILKYSSNLTIAEISEVCECAEGTVKSRLFYAIKEIKSKLSFEKTDSI